MANTLSNSVNRFRRDAVAIHVFLCRIGVLVAPLIHARDNVLVVRLHKATEATPHAASV